ncbi:MAG: spore germination protein [Firmicutes bacterium]|nr:spore germination protein [Bacillota bacterium]
MGLWQRLFNRNKKSDLKGFHLSDSLVISQREGRLKEKLSVDLKSNLTAIRDLYGTSSDLSIRHFKAGPEQVQGAIVNIEGLVAKHYLENILEVVQIDSLKTRIEPSHQPDFYQVIKERLLTALDIKEISTFDKLCENLASGHAMLFINGVDQAICCGAEGWEKRAVEEPAAEASIRGPREGFTESIRTNTAMIRRRLKTPNLWIESLSIGKLTRTQVAFAYVKGLTSDKLVAEVRSRLQRIDIDAVLESGYIEEFIEDTPFTLFPLMARTERPDWVSASLLEGKVAIFTDGTPFVLLAPITFIELLQAPDDYYERVPIAILIRNLRIIAYWGSIFLPGVYVAVTGFHHELLPSELVLRIASSRQGVPFPVMVEVFIMQLAFEMLREAGIRLPRAIGSAISIVGALILGEAAIRAGLVSPAVIIIVALTAIASFTVPAFNLGQTSRLLLFLFIILGGTIGLFGIQLGLLLLLVHLCTLRSFGTPYFMPIGPMVFTDWRDAFIRTWWWNMLHRPHLVGSREMDREKPGQMPRPEPRRRE